MCARVCMFGLNGQNENSRNELVCRLMLCAHRYATLSLVPFCSLQSWLVLPCDGLMKLGKFGDAEEIVL